MIVLGIQLKTPDSHGTVGQLSDTATKGLLCWTHWFFGTYTTKYLYLRGTSVTFDVDYNIVYRWKRIMDKAQK